MVAGADAAFHVMADAGRWQQAVHLAAACLASNCSQSAQLLVYSPALRIYPEIVDMKLIT